jgi:flagellar biosynthesis/type III secretory pathway protein FliH
MPNIKTAEEAKERILREAHYTAKGYANGLPFKSQAEYNAMRDGFAEGYLAASTTTAAEIERLRERVKELEEHREAELKHLFGVLLFQAFRTEDDELVTVTSITETFADYGITE